MKSFIRPLFLAFALMLGAFAGALAQKALPQRSQFLVNDYANLLSREEVVSLGKKLSDYAKQSSTQIVVVIEPSLEGEDAFDYSNRLARAWGIGGKENDNGILIYVARDDRKVRIQTGYGAEGFLPDALSKRIIDQIIVPAFKQGQYYQGLDQATSAIMKLGAGEYTNEQPSGNNGGAGAALGFVFLVVIFLLVFMYLVSRRNQNNRRNNKDDDDDGGYYRGGKYDMDDRHRGGGWIFLPGPGWGGGGGNSQRNSDDGWGGFGGGDFGGFGGGDFGGGGAGGDW